MSDSAKSTRKNVQKRKNAGLRQIKVWVSNEEPKQDVYGKPIKSEADKVRGYAAKQPKTKAILVEL